MKMSVSLFLLLLFVFPVAAQEYTGTLSEIKKSGKVRIGYRTSLPPMSYENNKGVPEGYSIDLCSAIVRDVEKTLNRDIAIEFIAVNTKNRFDALTANEIDILCGAATETLGRRVQVDFTQHIFVTGGAYLIRRGDNIKNNFSGKKIGVTKNTTTAKSLKELFEEAGVDAQIVQFSTTTEGFNSLLDKEVDAFSADQVVLLGLLTAARNMGEFSILPDLFTYEPIALAVRRNDADFRLVADKVISKLYRTGGIQKIYERWFAGLPGVQPSALQAMYQLNSLPE